MLHVRKLSALPTSGKVVVAHPRNERSAIKVAKEQNCPYMLRAFMAHAEADVMVIDLDAMPKVGEFWL